MHWQGLSFSFSNAEVFSEPFLANTAVLRSNITLSHFKDLQDWKRFQSVLGRGIMGFTLSFHSFLCLLFLCWLGPWRRRVPVLGSRVWWYSIKGERNWQSVDYTDLVIIPEPSVESKETVKTTPAVSQLPLIFRIEEVEVNPVQLSMWYFNQIRIKGKQRKKQYLYWFLGDN